MIRDPYPNYVSFNGIDTTNLSALNESQLASLSNLTLHNSDIKIKWLGVVNAVAVDHDINIGTSPKFASVNVGGLGNTYNSIAEITMYNVSCTDFKRSQLLYNPGILSNYSDMIQNSTTITCPQNKCTNINCISDILTFQVGSFSSYAYGANSNLTIDKNVSSINAGEQIRFYADYVNSTSGQAITGATVNITTADHTEYTMQDLNNGTYEVNLTLTTTGTQDYTIYAYKTGYNLLEANDIYTVNSNNPTPEGIPELSDYALMLVIGCLIGITIYRRRN